MKTRFTFLALFLLMMSRNFLIGEEEIDVTQRLRILDLMPRDQIVSPLGIEPAIPDNFVALNADGEKSICGWVFLGPETAIKDFVKDPQSLKEPLLAFRIGPMSQKEFGKLDEEDIREVCKQYKGLKCSSGSWGIYPYVLISGEVEDFKVNMACVGQNSDGTTIVFKLECPKDKALEQAAEQLWNRFINETKQLPEPLLYKSQGQEMHPGYTICDVAGRTMMLSVEWDEKNQVQVVAEPLEGNIRLEFFGAILMKMEGEWNKGEPLVKIDGMFNVDSGHVNCFQTLSVFPKRTRTFSKPSKQASFHQILQLGGDGTLSTTRKDQ